MWRGQWGRCGGRLVAGEGCAFSLVTLIRVTRESREGGKAEEGGPPRKKGVILIQRLGSEAPAGPLGWSEHQPAAPRTPARCPVGARAGTRRSVGQQVSVCLSQGRKVGWCSAIIQIFYFSAFVSSPGLSEINYMHELLTNMIQKRCVLWCCLAPLLLGPGCAAAQSGAAQQSRRPRCRRRRALAPGSRTSSLGAGAAPRPPCPRPASRGPGPCLCPQAAGLPAALERDPGGAEQRVPEPRPRAPEGRAPGSLGAVFGLCPRLQRRFCPSIPRRVGLLWGLLDSAERVGGGRGRNTKRPPLTRPGRGPGLQPSGHSLRVRGGPFISGHMRAMGPLVTARLALLVALRDPRLQQEL